MFNVYLYVKTLTFQKLLEFFEGALVKGIARATSSFATTHLLINKICSLQSNVFSFEFLNKQFEIWKLIIIQKKVTIYPDFWTNWTVLLGFQIVMAYCDLHLYEVYWFLLFKLGLEFKETRFVRSGRIKYIFLINNKAYVNNEFSRPRESTKGFCFSNICIRQ